MDAYPFVELRRNACSPLRGTWALEHPNDSESQKRACAAQLGPCTKLCRTRRAKMSVSSLKSIRALTVTLAENQRLPSICVTAFTRKEIETNS